jgi:hypothetical protein
LTSPNKKFYTYQNDKGESNMAKKPNFEIDICELAEKMQDDNYATAFYAALCNVQWLHFAQMTKDAYGCTWRYAGELVARLRDNDENYMDFYCSGNEGKVRKDVLSDLKELGYKPIPYVFKNEIPDEIEIYD